MRAHCMRKRGCPYVRVCGHWSRVPNVTLLGIPSGICPSTFAFERPLMNGSAERDNLPFVSTRSSVLEAIQNFVLQPGSERSDQVTKSNRCVLLLAGSILFLRCGRRSNVQNNVLRFPLVEVDRLLRSLCEDAADTFR